jgi:hypothetical protein
MVSPYKVILELYHALDVVWVIVLQQEQQFGLHSRLVIILFLIFDQLESYFFASLVVRCFYDLTKRSFAD